MTNELEPLKLSANLMVAVRFPKDAELIAKVKRLSGRRWDKIQQHWTVPLTFQNIAKLESWGFTLDQHLQDWFERQLENAE
mgnify:CR=1 FL=1